MIDHVRADASPLSRDDLVSLPEHDRSMQALEVAIALVALLSALALAFLR